MATLRRSLLANILPDNSGDVYPDGFENHASNDFWKQTVMVFAQDTANVNYLYGSAEIPEEYVDTANAVVIWTAAATTGDVQFDFEYRVVDGNDTESLDQATAEQAVTVGDSAPSAAFERLESSVALTDANLHAGATIQWRLGRDGPTEDAGTSMADEVLVFDLMLEFNDA